MATVSNNPKFVTLVTGDGKKFPMSLKAVEKCRVISRMFEHTDVNEENEVPFDRLKAITMEKLIDWLVHHEDDPKADEAEKKDNADVLIPEWDKKFLAQFDQSALFDVIMAANYLDIPNLLEMCCKTVAGMIMGKTVEEIRRTFGIKNDFTPAEEEQIRLENAWCEE